ncbi:BTAD domain-containing putative transcriptional regulator [Dactylosporangium sp. NPDC051541]|uniref:BTAD domain-containing putative transcriptional regulator n=1 Tax=Dactylosporangium sp. NPDC051541 TaxID=3363977 RepID=UPI0037AEBB78
MRITTLGPLAVDGRPVRGDRLAAVIRELVDARGRTLSTWALVDAVWRGAPPDDAPGAVQALVSRVRRLGVPVLAAPGGYRIPVDGVEIDAVTARGLVERGQAALRAGDAGRARGSGDAARALFPEVPELGDTGRARLFSDIVALRAEAALAGGGPHDEADLRRLATRVPPDEPAAALLVRVLAAQGRDAEALDLVERVRAELADRYGADPAPVLAAAHVALLRGQLAVVRPPRAEGLPAGWRRPATPLVGREPDLAAVHRALGDAPVVTVVATGGAGKTRLAAEVARAVDGARPVRVVELAGLRAPAEVRPAVLAALPGLEPGGLLAFDGLLVLDNCEHVLDAAAAVVTELLTLAPPGFGALATSRAPLGLAGEVVHRLPALPDADAVALLEARARAGGAVAAGPPERTLELCHRLDNLPLALELAAARLRHMPIDDVLAGLADRFALLDDALRGLPDRHASLWAMVDWSRELLDPAERQVLERLAVIPAPFTAELAVATAGPAVANAAVARRALAVLVEQSLLRLEAGADAPRYRMLETVREYGEARLAAAGDRAAAMTGLVGWARERAVALAADFVGPNQIPALEACAADQDNLAAAQHWAQEHADEPAVVDVALALFQLWTVRGQHLEANAAARTLLHADEPAARRRSSILHGAAAGRPLPHADRLARLCILISVNGGNGGSMRLTALARRALRTVLRERPAEVSPRNTALAAVLPGLEQADPDRSRADAATLIAHPDPYVQGMGHFIRAVLADDPQTQPVDAELAYRRFETAGDHWAMGMAAHAAGHTTSTGEWLRRSERHLDLVGAARDARSTQVLLDTHLALTGDPDAERRLRETTTTDDANVAAQAHLGLAELAWQRHDPTETSSHADAILRTTALAGTATTPQSRAELRIAAAVIHLWTATTDPPAAAKATNALRDARDDVLTAHDRPLLGTWALGGAELAAFRGDTATARELWSLGTRVGANTSRFAPAGRGEPLTAALTDHQTRTRLLTQAAATPGTAAYTRIATLMTTLLG